MENEIPIMLINGVEYWFIDGNYFSKQSFGTLEVAQSKAKTLINCVGCFDCTDCQNCNYCNSCFFSDSLRYCNGCRYCQNCEFCNNLSYCKDCSFIIAQNDFFKYLNNNIPRIL